VPLLLPRIDRKLRKDVTFLLPVAHLLGEAIALGGGLVTISDRRTAELLCLDGNSCRCFSNARPKIKQPETLPRC